MITVFQVVYMMIYDDCRNFQHIPPAKEVCPGYPSKTFACTHRTDIGCDNFCGIAGPSGTQFLPVVPPTSLVEELESTVYPPLSWKSKF